MCTFVKGQQDISPKILLHPSEDLQDVPTEFKAVVGHSQTEPSNGWRGEKVVWVGGQEAPYALTYNTVGPQMTLICVKRH